MKNLKNQKFSSMCLSKISISKSTNLPLVAEFMRDYPRKVDQTLENYLRFLKTEYEIWLAWRDFTGQTFEQLVKERYSVDKFSK